MKGQGFLYFAWICIVLIGVVLMAQNEEFMSLTPMDVKLWQALLCIWVLVYFRRE